LDAVLGAEAVGAELRRSVGRSPLFVAATAIAKKDRQNFTRDDAMAIYAASRTNQLRKSSSAASQPSLGCAELRLGRRVTTREGCLDEVGLPVLAEISSNRRITADRRIRAE